MPEPTHGTASTAARCALASDARRFDVSPAWHSWVAQAPALELLTEVGIDVLHDHAVGLANRFCTAVGMPAGNSAIVSVATSRDVGPQLEQAGIAASSRGGRLRLAFHLNNNTDDADRAAETLTGMVHL